MPTRQKANQPARYFKGQKSGIAPEVLAPEDSAIVTNFLLNQGTLEKVPGYSVYYNDTVEAGDIVSLHRYNYKWIFQRGDNLFIEDSEDAATFSILASSLSASTIYSDRWKDNIYFVNGTDFKYYNGSSFYDESLLPPGGGTVNRTDLTFTDITGGSGSVETAVTYLYTITLYDSATQTESLPNGALLADNGLLNTSLYDSNLNPGGWIASSHTTGGTATDVQITNLQAVVSGYPSRADKIRIYRCVQDGTADDMFLVGTADITDTTFTDGTSSANLVLNEVLITADKQPAPNYSLYNDYGMSDHSGPTFIRQWRNQLWTIGSKTSKVTVSDSTKGDSYDVLESENILHASDVNLPDYYPFFYPIGSGDGQKITGLGVVKDQLAVFKEGSIYSIIGSNADNFLPKRIDSVHGCLNANTIQETPFGVVCLDRAGVIIFTGVGEAKVISDDIKDEIDNINFAQLDNASSAYDPFEQRYYLQIPSGTNIKASKTLVFKFDEPNGGAWSVIDGREGSSILYGAGSNSLVRALIGSQSSGQLRSITDNTVATNNGSRITAVYESGQFIITDESQKKKAIFVHILAESATDFTIDVTITSDYGQSGQYRVTDFNSVSSFSEYGTAIWDSSLWGAETTRKRVKIPVKAVGRTFSIRVKEKSTDPDQVKFRLLGVALECSVMGS